MKEFFVEFEMRPTVLNELFTQDQMNDAKAAVLKELKDMDIDAEQKNSFTDWVTDKDTVFGPKEVSLIISSLQEDN